MLTIVGDTTVEIIVRGVPQPPTDRLANGPAARTMITDSRVVPTLGGKGAAAAYISGALGEMVRLWSAVGSDSFGELVLGWLEGRHVDTTSVRIMGEAGTSTIILISGKDSQEEIIYYPGVSQAFAPRARSVGGGGADWLFIAGYGLLPQWRGDNTLELLRNARRNGLNTALDFSLSPEDKPVTAEELRLLLNSVSVLLCDQADLERILDRSVQEGAPRAIESGVGAVVVRLNSGGAMVFGKEFSEAREVQGFSPEKDGPVDASAFDAGFLFARAKGSSLEESAGFGCATAFITAGATRGTLDAPDEAAVNALLRKQSV